jgi:ABC-type Co2+ transport system permease subunit
MSHDLSSGVDTWKVGWEGASMESVLTRFILRVDDLRQLQIVLITIFGASIAMFRKVLQLDLKKSSYGRCTILTKASLSKALEEQSRLTVLR